MMQKYKTRTKRRGVYQPANYFLSVGDNNLQQFNSHITYSFDEFIRDAKNPENIIIANTATEFTNAISLLINNKKLAKKIGENGQLLIEKYFSKSFVINQLNNIID